MDNFFKWLSAIAAGCFAGFIAMCFICIFNSLNVAEIVNVQWSFVAALVIFLFVLWDCYRWDFKCWKDGND